MGWFAVAIVAAGCAGLVGCFLPRGSSLWEARSDLQVYWVFAAFVVAIAMGALGGLRPPLRRWHAVLAAEAFLVVGLKFRLGFFALITDGSIGGRLIAGAAIAGLLVSLVAALRPRAAG